MKTLLFTKCVDLSGSACRPFSGTKTYVSTGAVDVDHINDSNTEIVDYDGKPSRANLEVKAGDILFAKMQGTKKTLMIDAVLAENIYSTGFCAVRAKEDVLTKRCLYHLLTSDVFLAQKDKNCSGATQKAITNAGLGRIAIQVPSIDNQDEIADQLDVIKRIMTKRQQELSTLDDLIRALFIEMFGDPNDQSPQWPEATIGENCFVTKLAGFEYTSYIHYEDHGDVVMVKAQNVKNGSLNDKELSYISNEVSDSLPRSQLSKGDVVMTYVGANIGDAAIIDDRHKYHLAPNVAKIRPNGEVYNPTFFMYMLMMKTSYIMKNSADTAKAALGMERIRKLRVLVPPIELQNDFAALVAQVNRSKTAVQKALNETQLLYDSMMQKYFG